MYFSLNKKLTASILMGGLLTTSQSSQADLTSYTDSTAWNSNVTGVTSIAVPQPTGSSGLIGYGAGTTASATYDGITVSSNFVTNNAGLFIISTNPPVLSEQGAAGLENISITFQNPVEGFSLNYGTFAFLNYGSPQQSVAPNPHVTFLLSNGDSITQASGGTGYYDTPSFVGVTDTTSFTSVLVTAPAPVTGGYTELNLNNLSFAVSTVPVPASMWLFGSALAGLIGFNRRKSA